MRDDAGMPACTFSDPIRDELDSPGRPAAGVVGVLLAAGHARRFGRDKRQLPWRGGPTLMEAALRPLLSVCERVVVVLPPGDAWGLLCSRAHGAGVAWSFARGQGLAASLSSALPQVGAASAMLVALADMGDVQVQTLERLVQAWRRHPGQLVLPVHAGQPGNPRLVPQVFYERLVGLSGDDGVRRALDWSAALRVPVDDAGVLRDVDVPADA